MFKFTFSVGNSSSNPFAAEAEERDRVQRTVAPQSITRKLPAPPRRPLPPSSMEDIQPSKKRGWAPTSSSASAPASQPTLTNGWIDTPSRYLEAASQSHQNGGEDDMDVDFPPAKRRKTLTDSIISTAFSAALIGTAVGMTAYRMWRDRGKPTGEAQSEPMESPPPPYKREEWVDAMPQAKQAARTARLPRKPRPATRRTPRHRMAPIAVSPSRSPVRIPSPSKFSTFQSEENRDDHGDLEDQMDWMGDKIRSLIEEGQKALGKEVVIVNEDQNNDEGAVDDGMDGWEEDDSQAAEPLSPSSSSFRRLKKKPPHSLAISRSVSPPARSTSPASYGSTPTSPRLKRSQPTAGGRSGSSAYGSPYLTVPSSARLGGRTSDGVEDIKVIYEPATNFSNSNLHQGNFEDDDSRGLAERMEKIRKAYKIH